MDEQGYLSVEGVNAVSRKVFADDPSGMTRSMEFTEACKSGNKHYPLSTSIAFTYSASSVGRFIINSNIGYVVLTQHVFGI